MVAPLTIMAAIVGATDQTFIGTTKTSSSSLVSTQMRSAHGGGEGRLTGLFKHINTVVDNFIMDSALDVLDSYSTTSSSTPNNNDLPLEAAHPCKTILGDSYDDVCTSSHYDWMIVQRWYGEEQTAVEDDRNSYFSKSSHMHPNDLPRNAYRCKTMSYNAVSACVLCLKNDSTRLVWDGSRLTFWRNCAPLPISSFPGGRTYHE